jgi:hypothetical protein
MHLPESLQINAFDGIEVPSGSLAPEGGKWALRNPPFDVRRFLKPEALAQPENWKDERVGWGLIVAEPPGASPADLINNADLPQCLLDLLKDRGDAPVLRYRAGAEHRFRVLQNWRDDRRVDTASSTPGVAPGCLPNFLMIWGTPEEVPWTLQYQLGASGRRFIGRLPLKGTALDNYVKALRSNWADAKSDVHSPLTWAPEHSPNDMTATMRATIAEPLAEKFRKDSDLKPLHLAGSDALHSKLTDALKTRKPGFVVSTSHGFTRTLTDTDLMKHDLGLLMDQNLSLMDLDSLMQVWQPDGAIWYSHACCSAGCDSISTFRGLLEPASKIAKNLESIAALGAHVSRLATTLLGSEKPARAFIGHVEPTFNWTLQQPDNQQFLTHSLITALYQQMFLGKPCGFAFGDWYARYGSYSTAYQNYQREYDGSKGIQAQMLYQRLVAQDIQSLVLLGDPAVTLL